MLETMCADEIYGLTKNEILENVKKVTPQSLLAAWKFMLKNGIIQLNAIGNVSEDDCKRNYARLFRTSARERRMSRRPFLSKRRRI